jgi:hypothetical protein
MKTYEQQRDEILADFAASEWLKRAVLALDKRDPVDAADDVTALLDLQHVRLFDLEMVHN